MAEVMRSVRVEDEPVVIDYRKLEPPPAALLPPVESLPASLSIPPPLPLAAVPMRIEPEPVPPAAPPRPSEEEQRAALDRRRREAYEDGYREGLAKGEKAGGAELADQAAQLRALLASVREALEQGIAGAEDMMVEIAFAAACKVLGEAAASKEGVRAMVREALRQVSTKEGLVLRLSPADYARLAANGPLAEGARLELAADERVAAGGCLIETAGGTLDARLEVQLRQLLDTLARAREAQGE